MNFGEEFLVKNIYGWHGYLLFTMENEIIMNLSIVLGIVLEKSSFKITLIFLTFHQFWIRSSDLRLVRPVAKPLWYVRAIRQQRYGPLPPNPQVSTVFIETTAKAKYRLQLLYSIHFRQLNKNNCSTNAVII